MNALHRARAYVASQPPAVSGCKGHNNTFRVACYLIGFGLNDAEALDLLREFSARCQPPWTEKQLMHKIQDARKVVKLVRTRERWRSTRVTWKPEWFPAGRFVPAADLPSGVPGVDRPKDSTVVRATGAEVQQTLNLPNPDGEEPARDFRGAWNH
jgi:hypothetical protein